MDDDERIRTLEARSLRRLGYTVLPARHGMEAQRLAANYPRRIDLLLTDVVMPGMSGKELSAAVVELWPAINVLFMSGYSHDVIVHQGVLDEGVRLIEKPFSADDLLRKVRDVLDAGSIVA